MSKTSSRSLRVRNHFRPEEYFSFNIRNGVRRSPSGVRIVTFPEDFFLGVHEALEDETGSAAPVILYSCGRWWGRRFIRQLFDEMRQFYKEDATSLPTSVFLQVLRRVWGLHGWGRIEIDFHLQDHGFIEATVEHGMYSQVVGGLGRPSEDLVAGMLASIVSELAGRDLECVQTTCTSKGDAHATFLLGLQTRIEIVKNWLKQGRNHAAVRETIEAGQLA